VSSFGLVSSRRQSPNQIIREIENDDLRPGGKTAPGFFAAGGEGAED
jgi:hypothetical protein